MRIVNTLGLVLVAVATTACGSTSLKTTWRNPDAKAVALEGQKVAALVVSRNEATRRVAEDALAADLTAGGLRGAAAYTILPASAYEDSATAKAAFVRAGVEGVVVVRFLGKEERTVVTDNPTPLYPYRDFWRYYPYGWSATTTTVQQVSSMETLVYSLKQGALLWTGTSESVNMSNTAETMRELMTVVGKRLRKDGLVK